MDSLMAQHKNAAGAGQWQNHVRSPFVCRVFNAICKSSSCAGGHPLEVMGHLCPLKKSAGRDPIRPAPSTQPPIGVPTYGTVSR